MTVDFPDYDEAKGNAVALSVTDLTTTGLAKELGGNLATHTALLNGTQAGALIANIGLTIAQETAALIASGSATGTAGGTPLLHGARQVFSVTGQVIAASGTFTTGAITITKPGYLIRVTGLMSGANAAVPFLEADVQWWVNPNNGQLTSEEIWYLNCGSASAVRTNGKGPTKGDRMSIAFTNGDAVDSVTVNIQVWETTQHITRDDWRNAGGVASATATGINADGLANIIASDSVNVPANSTKLKNMPLYAGQVNITINQNVAAASQVNIQPIGDFNLASAQPVAILDWTKPLGTLYSAILPRCPCQVVVFNGGAGAVNLLIGITALEYAS